MPIVTLQDDEFGFPEIGRIRLGVMKEKTRSDGSKVSYPAESPHFVLKDAQELIPLYDKEPTELLIYLPYQERDRNFRAYYEEFRSGGLYCQGTGADITYLIDPEGSAETVIRNGVVIRDYRDADGDHAVGEMVACPGAKAEDAPYARCANCRARALLFVLVRDPNDPLRLANDQWGYYRISTGSYRNIEEITRTLNTLSAASAMFAKESGLAGIPMILKRIPRMMGTRTVDRQSGEAKRIQTEKYFLSLEVDPMWVKRGALAIAANALGRNVDSLLSAPDAQNTDPNGDYDVEVVDGEAEYVDMDAYVPAELDNLPFDMTQEEADLMAMKGEKPPADWGEFHARLQPFMGSAYRADEFLRDVKKAMGIARNKELPLNKAVWGMACDLMIGKIAGTLG